MDEYTLSEAVLSKSEKDALKKKGFKNIVDKIEDINGDNTLVDASLLDTVDEKKYIENLAALCKKLEFYMHKILTIPVEGWMGENGKDKLGILLRFIKQNPIEFKKKFPGYVFIFYNDNKESFALYVDEYKSTEYNTVINLITVLNSSHAVHKLTGDGEKSPVKDQTKSNKKEELKAKKDELVDAIATAAENSDSEEEAWENAVEDERIAELISELEEEDDGRPNFNSARTSRIAKLNDELLQKKVNGRLIRDIINDKKIVEDLPKEHLKVASINEEWEEVGFVNFEKVYDINSDIFAMLQALSSKSYPISVLDIKIDDTSTNMDYVDTYTVQLEDAYGKRFSLVFDVPKFKNNRFMRLRGNEKVMSGQLVLLPCMKTDEDTVQCISNYNKIFIRRHATQNRTHPLSDKLIKALNKYIEGGGKKIKISTGDNRAICSKYELPIDYIDIASNFNKIETKDHILLFNQDDYKEADRTKGIPYAIEKQSGKILYFSKDPKKNDDRANDIITTPILALIRKSGDEDFDEIYASIKTPNSLGYSEASILSNRIPLVVVLGYTIGLSALIRKFPDKVHLITKKSEIGNAFDNYNFVKFSDGYLAYSIDYAECMLFSGLLTCGTESYSITDIDKKSMWLDFLDEFGGRILADGLDNFEDLFMDPITIEVCQHMKMPDNYIDLLLYANRLLADNKYNRHTDISGNRYRTNELVAGYFYKVLARSYAEYKAQVKRGRKVGMTMKRSAVIDAIFEDPMTSDLSIMNPLLEIEASNSVSFKGLSGMNSDRSYGLDKRTYDDSMINKLALSTGFAANVGINRQTTIDMDVEGKRGYIKSTGEDDMSITKTFSMTEAITPFGTTRETI